MPIYDFKSEDDITHIVWELSDESLVEKINKIFGNEVESLYIADGHHRSASSVKVGLKRREENSDFTGDEEYNYFMSVMFPDEDLFIMDYNRVVHTLNGLLVCILKIIGMNWKQKKAYLMIKILLTA
jgi:uncharacterized protein (DUF1015 family)